jgi:hypothetical protein
MKTCLQEIRRSSWSDRIGRLILAAAPVRVGIASPANPASRTASAPPISMA